MTTSRPVTLEPDIVRALTRAARAAEQAVERRDRLILGARKAGASLREIEAVTGINYGTVRRMVERMERDDAD